MLQPIAHRWTYLYARTVCLLVAKQWNADPIVAGSSAQRLRGLSSLVCVNVNVLFEIARLLQRSWMTMYYFLSIHTFCFSTDGTRNHYFLPTVLSFPLTQHTPGLCPRLLPFRHTPGPWRLEMQWLFRTCSQRNYARIRFIFLTPLHNSTSLLQTVVSVWSCCSKGAGNHQRLPRIKWIHYCVWTVGRLATETTTGCKYLNITFFTWKESTVDRMRDCLGWLYYCYCVDWSITYYAIPIGAGFVALVLYILLLHHILSIVIVTNNLPCCYLNSFGKGTKLQNLLSIKRGPEIGKVNIYIHIFHAHRHFILWFSFSDGSMLQWIDRQLQWQLNNPSGTVDDCVKYLLQLKK